MTQSSPMDFEKEAREIAWGFACGNCGGDSDEEREALEDCCEADGCVALMLDVEQALRRAYTAGQKDMRESCALVVEAFPKEAGDRADIVNRDLRLAIGIRMHPILSPDHEKVGGK